MGLKEDIRDSSNIAREMISNNESGDIYKRVVLSAGEANTPGLLKWGCFPIAVGTAVGVYREITGKGREHVIPTVTAGLILLGLGKVLQKVGLGVDIKR